MKLARIILVSSLAFAAIACGGSIEQQPQTTASAVTKAPVGQNTHGAVKVVGDALGEVSLRTEQRTALEQMAVDAETRHAPSAAARTDLMNSFAGMVEAGAIDTAALQAKVDVVAGDLEQIRTDDRAALVKLHDLLDKDQRDEFADAMEKQLKSKHEAFGGGRGQLKQLASDLNLTDDQKDKIKDVLKDGFKDARHDMKAHFKDFKGRGKVIDAFREDKLDLDKAMPPIEIKTTAHVGAQHIGDVAAKILPILTPDQRKIAADKIRAFAAQGDASLLVH